MDVVHEVNAVAKGLQAALREAGHDVTDHEAQALSVVGLLAASNHGNPATSTVRLDPSVEADALALVCEVLEADPKNSGALTAKALEGGFRCAHCGDPVETGTTPFCFEYDNRGNYCTAKR